MIFINNFNVNIGPQMTKEELLATVNHTDEVLKKATAELGEKLATLQASIDSLQSAAANAEAVSPELEAAINAVAVDAKALDDLVPDAVVEDNAADETGLAVDPSNADETSVA